MAGAGSGIVDAHVHLSLDDGMRLRRAAHGAAEYLKDAQEAGIEAAAVLAMAPAGDLKRTREMNDLVLGVDLPGIERLAFCSVHPADGNAAMREIDRVAEAGASALKLHPNTQRFDVADASVADVVRRAGDHGLPVLFDAFSPGDPAQVHKFVELATACTESRIVLAHLNGPKFPEMLTFAIQALYDWWPRHVWFDVSWVVPTFAGSPFAEQLLWVCRELGTDRLLFGSDYPLVSVADAVTGVRELGFTAAELAQILRANAVDLYGLDAR